MMSGQKRKSPNSELQALSDKLRKELEDRSRYIDIINSFHDRISDGLNNNEVAEAAVKSLMQFSGSPAVILFDFDIETKKIQVNFSEGFTQEAVDATAHIKLDNSLTGRAILSREIQYSEALNLDEIIEDHCSATLSDDKFKSVCSIPLLYGQTPIGAVNLIFRNKQDFNAIDKKLLMSIAKTISIALQNTRFIGKIQDEFRLREAGEERYKAVVNDQSEFIVRWLPEGIITFTNKAYDNLIGLNGNEVIGKSIYKTMPKKDSERLKRHVKKLTPESASFVYENEVISKVGKKHITEWNNRGIFDDDKHLNEIQSVGIDLTEMRNAQIELEENRQKFYKLFESSPNILVITNLEDARIIEINDTACGLLGYDKNELIGKSAVEIGLISDERLGLYLNDLKQKGSINGREITFRRNDGTIAEGIIYSRYIKLKGSMYLFHTVVDISERKTVELKLSESESKYRLLIENQNDYILKFTTKGKILYASPNFIKAFGTSEKEVIKNYYLPEIHPDDADDIQPILENALKPPYQAQHEERMKTIQGWRWIAWSNKPIENPDGSIDEIISVGRDINDRKETEIELQQNREMFRNVINSLPDYVIINDYEMNTLFVNKSLTEETGLTLEDLNSGDEKYNSVFPEDRKRVEKFAEDFMKSEFKISDQIDNRFLTANGEIRWHSSIISKINFQGKPALLYLTRDVTDRKKDEDEIRKLALIAKETINGVFIANQVGHVEWINEGYERITGYSLANIAGRRTEEILHGEKTNSETEAAVRLALDEEKSIRTELLSYRKNGEEFWNELTIQPMYDADNTLTGYMGIIADVTERKSAENKLKANQVKLSSLTAHLQKVRERERQDIARGIHDELGQVLTALKMNIKLLQRDITGQEECLNRDSLLSELDSLSQMVDESVKSSKRIIKDLRPELLDKLGLVAAIEQHITDFCSLAGLKHKFKYNAEEFELENDIAIGIFRLVQEALNNTVKYAKASSVEIELTKEDDFIKLSVEDNGIGFDSASQNKKNSFGLLGMRESILNFGGEFNLKTGKNRGTKINIAIPLNL